MRLNQVIATEKHNRQAADKQIDAAYKAIQKPSLFDGHTKEYRKNSYDGEDVPREYQRVQVTSQQVTKIVSENMAKLLDVVAQKDSANCVAKASVVVDGETLIEDAPATFLLFLEKRLIDIRTMLSKLPILDAAEDWIWNDSVGLFKSAPRKTSRTKKVQKAIVLFPATDKHPAQTQLITEDEVVGQYDYTRLSGAIKREDGVALMERVDKLYNAVKHAREQANLVDAPEKNVGDKVMGYLFR